MWFSFYENWFNKQLNIADFNYALIAMKMDKVNN